MAEAEGKNGVGRPTEYDQEYVDGVVETLPSLFAEGESVAEVCAKLGMAKDTFYRLVADYPEFSDAYKKGLELSEAWWTTLGRAGACGKVPIQPATWVFNMKNRFGWKDKHEHSGPGGSPIPLGHSIAGDQVPMVKIQFVNAKDGKPEDDVQNDTGTSSEDNSG